MGWEVIHWSKDSLSEMTLRNKMAFCPSSMKDLQLMNSSSSPNRNEYWEGEKR